MKELMETGGTLWGGSVSDTVSVAALRERTAARRWSPAWAFLARDRTWMVLSVLWRGDSTTGHYRLCEGGEQISSLGRNRAGLAGQLARLPPSGSMGFGSFSGLQMTRVLCQSEVIAWV